MVKFLIKYLRIIIMCVFIFSLINCTKKNEIDDVYKNASNTCDTVNVTYTKSIQVIFNDKCISCHSNDLQQPNLNSYQNIITYFNTTTNGANILYEKVAVGSHENIVLSDCEKAQLKKWISNLAPQL